MLVLPGPGLAVLTGGLLLLAAEFLRARKALRAVSGGARHLFASLRSAFRRVADRAGYALSLLPVLTDWIDTGHLPQHPRELVTEVIVGIVILVGIHRVHARADRFRAEAETDALTGLLNRRRFRRDVDVAMARARQTQRPLLLAFLDVDRFKSLNDALGHHAGDEVLRAVSRALERSTRQGIDGCYRLGGDEFAVLIDGLEGPRALEALGRGFRSSGNAGPADVSCSVGVVALDSEERAEAFVKRADAAMYAAKRGLLGARPELRGFAGKLGRGRLVASTPVEDDRAFAASSASPVCSH